MPNQVLVLGIGNTLFTDDAAGLLVIRAVQARWTGAGVDFAEAMAGGLELMDLLSGYRAAVIVDAAVTGQAVPGEIYTLAPESLGTAVTGGAHGAHLGTALEVARRLGLPMPERLEVVAIEAQDVSGFGESLTPALAAAIEPAAAFVLRLAEALVQEVSARA